jgi:predicted Zn-dependent protease
VNIERIRSVLAATEGVSHWLIIRTENEATTVIRLPWVFSMRSGKVHADPNPAPREVITAPSDTVKVRVFSRFTADGEEWLGDATGQVASDDESALRRLFDSLVAGARSQRNKPFPLPGKDEPYPRVALADPDLADRSHAELIDRAQAFGNAVIKATEARPGVDVSNLELFINRGRTRLETSAGAVVEYPATRVGAEVCFLARPEAGPSGEHTARLHARRFTDLDPQAIASNWGDAARLVAAARPAPSWQGPVVLVGEACENALTLNYTPLPFHASARMVHERTSRHNPALPVWGEAELKGEPLNLVCDPLLPYGLASRVYAETDATACRPATLVAHGHWAELLGDRRYFHYLGLLDKGVRASGSGGNTVIPAGVTAEAELCSGDCVVIKAFSDWNVEDTSGDFSCEVRLGELRSGGNTTHFRGGLLIGNWFTAVADARFSKETQALGSYHGPRAVRFGSLTLAG